MKRNNAKVDILLIGKLSDHKTIKVWCPYCKKYHIHGWNKTSDVEHRVSHCDVNSSSPLKGYYIAVEK